MPHQIDVQFFSPEREELFKRCLEQIPNAENVIVRPLDRIGYSGANVFVFFPRGKDSNPHVGKIHTKEGIAREVRGRALAYHFFPEAMQKDFSVDADGGADLAMLATPLIAGEANQVTELVDLLFAKNPSAKDLRHDDAKWFKCPMDQVQGIIDRLYNRNCKKTFDAVATKHVNLKTEYAWYLRDSLGDEFLKTWLGPAAGQERVEIYGTKVPNPATLCRKLMSLDRTLPVSTVHGDLHPSNVVLDGNDPYLIDFSWCSEKSHVLKDFLIMECSIRFFLAPRHIGDLARRRLDETLLSPTAETVDGLPKGLRADGVDEATIAHLDRCARLVLQLRGLAVQACKGKFELADYLACQALVLYGLMKVPRYPFEPAAKAIGVIGKFLADADYV